MLILIIGGNMKEIMINIMNKYGYIGIMFLIAIENIFPPIPSEVILTFGGFMTKQVNSSLNIIGVTIAATLGSLIGAMILYYIGKLFNKEHLKKIISGKFGKILHLKPSDIEKADNWFDTKGNKTVFFCRFVPVIRSLISIPAGMSEMPIIKFLIYTGVGSLIWNIVLIYIGSEVGQNWETAVEKFDQYSLIFAVLLLIVSAVILYLKKIKKQQK